MSTGDEASPFAPRGVAGNPIVVCPLVTISINEAKCDPWRAGCAERKTSLVIGYGSMPWGFRTNSNACYPIE